MKNHFILICISLIITSCSNNEKTEEIESDPNAVTKQQAAKTDPTKKLPKYSSIEQMFNDANDFNVEQGTLKVIEKDPPKIQVSQMVFDGDSNDIIKEQVKRDIVYVVFQTFASTKFNSLTVTSVPLKMKDFQNREGYLENFRSTIKVSRDKAKAILIKFLNTDSFESLYTASNGSQIWLPNESFELLRFKHLQQVYSELED